jgi:LemA protein
MRLLCAVLVLLAIYFIWLYNRMVGLKKRAEGAWSDIDVQLKRRHDLVPSLVSCVEGYVAHEKNTLVNVTSSRQTAVSSQGTSERSRSEAALSQNLKSLILLAENYPNLKANTTFLSLQEKLTETENLIQNARRYYNAVVRDYNSLIHQFPGVFLAQAAGFGSLEFFQLDNQTEGAAQKVNL